MGYVSQRNPFSEEQSAGALLAVQFCQSVFPAILIAIAAIFILFFKLDEAKLEQLRKTTAASENEGKITAPRSLRPNSRTSPTS